MPDRDAAPSPASPAESDAASERMSAASTVAGGILLSRITGLARERAAAYFFGVGAHADVLQFAFRAPNLIQNLLGEGTISAAFIPIYSQMIEEGRERDAGRFAGAIFGLLLAVAAGLVLLGIVAAEPLVTVLAPGWTDDAARVAAGALPVDRFALAVQALRLTFPMVGFIVLAAWTLGVLNSHRRFFLPYVAPVLWNVAIISGLAGGAYWYAGAPWALAPDALASGTLNELLLAACWGGLAGGALQFLVQLPLVVRVLTGFRLSLSTAVDGVREAISASGPAIAGRGVAQISSYIDTILASLLAAGAFSALRYALILYFLPISLFGMSVAASELPELARLSDERVRRFLTRLRGSIRQILFLTIPTVVGYLAFGFLIVGALLRTGSFSLTGNWLVYFVLGGYSLGLAATTISRLLQNAFYALNDTSTPAKVAVLRVSVSAGLALPLMFTLDRIAVGAIVGGTPAETTLYLGAVGLGLGATGGAWVELWRLHAVLRRRVDDFALPWGAAATMTGLALLATVPAAALWFVLPDWHVIVQMAAVIGVYAGAYLAMAHAVGISELDTWIGRLRRG